MFSVIYVIMVLTFQFNDSNIESMKQTKIYSPDPLKTRLTFKKLDRNERHNRRVELQILLKQSIKKQNEGK